MNKKIAIYTLLALFIITFTSCENSKYNNVRIEADREAFDKNRKLWEESWRMFYVHYQFTYSFFGSAGPDAARVTVREDKESIIESIPDASRLPMLRIESMEDVFNMINYTFEFIESVKNGTHTGHTIRSITFEIRYCEQYHFPKYISLSTGYSQPVDGGGWWTLEISDFRRDFDDILIDADREAFDKNKNLWDEAGFKNYQFTFWTYTMADPFADRIRVTVREGEDTVIENITNPTHWTPQLLRSMSDVYAFIYRYFEIIESVENGTFEQHEVHKVRRITLQIEYCEQYNFPKSVTYHESFNQLLAGGPFRRIYVTDFKLLD